MRITFFSAALIVVMLAIGAAARSTSTPRRIPPAQATPAGTPPVNCPEVAAAMTRLLQNDARLRDWPDLARYRDASRSLSSASAQTRVVFMGDSITESWAQPRFAASFAGRGWIGRGISGQTTPQMLVRFRPDVIDLAPKAVVILAGTNDIAGNTGPMTNQAIADNLMSMAELAKIHGIKVILSSVLPVSEYHTAPNGIPQTTLRPMARIQALNDWMKRYAAAEHHVYLDYFSAMVDDKGLLRTELSADDLHPNAQGYTVMAPLAEAAISQALKER